MLVGTADGVCPYEEAKRAAELIGDAVEVFETYEGKDHGYLARQNDEEFVQFIVDLMQTHTEDERDTGLVDYTNCRRKETAQTMSVKGHDSIVLFGFAILLSIMAM